MSYQGWKNYETWAVHLWLSNDQGTHEYWGEAALAEREAAPSDENCRTGVWTVEECAKFRLADRLKDELADGMPELEGLWSNLLQSAFEDVDWHEIAAAYLELAKEPAHD